MMKIKPAFNLRGNSLQRLLARVKCILGYLGYTLCELSGQRAVLMIPIFKNSETLSTEYSTSRLTISEYLRGKGSVQQRKILEDVEQDLLRQTLPVDSLFLPIFLSSLLAGAFKGLLRPTAGTPSVLLLITLETSFHPGLQRRQKK